MNEPEAEPSAIVIAGPTASGKSTVAMELAVRRNGVVINADSMQVYREIRLLTARPSPEEEARVPHRLYGHVGLAEPYSVARWLAEVAATIEGVRAVGKLPVIVGGTGLYLMALLDGLSPVPEIPSDVRAKWRAESEARSAEALFAELRARDELTAAQLRPSDTQRVVRALEVIEATGRPLAEWQKVKGIPVIARQDARLVVVSRPRQELYERSARRFDEMIVAGALEEAGRVRAMKLPDGLPGMRALGLRPLIAHLDGEATLEAAVEDAKRDTRHYIRRQSTWINGRMIAWEGHFAQ